MNRPEWLNADGTGAPTGFEKVKVLGKAAGSYIANRTIGRLFGAGLSSGAESDNIIRSSARWSTRTQQTDWRVKLQLPSIKANSLLFDVFFSLNKTNEILKPLYDLNGLVFPLTPSVILQHTASYNPLAQTHSNFPFYAYSNSEPQSITIVGEFPVQNKEDASYWVASLHFLRTVTKMFFGDDDSGFKGNPPPILKLNGYGNHVFKDVPVVVTNFSVELTDRVDYISTTQTSPFAPKQGDTFDTDISFNRASTIPETWAPTQSIFTVQVQPVYSRESVKRFNMRDFANGTLSNKDGIGYI